MTALFPGSFDPVTLGHLDIINRAAALFDTVIVAVLENKHKKCLFTSDERASHLRQVCVNIHNAEVRIYDGLLYEFFEQTGSDVVIRGLRNCAEFETEMQYAQAFLKVNAKMQTIFIPSLPEHAFVNSGMAREVAAFNGDLRLLLPDIIISAVRKKCFGRAVDGDNIRFSG